jgi:peptidyl-prolyl cis-trans isomerase D
MAVLERLRARGALVSTIIGIALLSFVVGDFFTGGRFGGAFNDDSIGIIGGVGISYTEYNARIDYFNAVYAAMGRTAQTESDEVREQAWYALVQEYAIEPEYRALGLAVSKDELFDLVQGRRPSALAVRYFSDPNTGEFDRARVIQYLQNIDADPNPDAKTMWLYLEKEIAHQRVQEKLLALVSKSLYATSLEAKTTLEGSANSVDIEYVLRSYSEVSDSAINVSSSDIKKYYKQHKKRYEQTENCDIEYVALPIAASPEDDAEVKSWIENLEPQFAATKDVRAFCAQHSDAGFDDTYYKKSDLDASIADFAFSSTTADFLPSFKDGSTYKMARIADIRILPDSVQARHILVKPRSSIDLTRTLADSIKKAIQRGASFADLSDKYSGDQAAAQKGGDLGWFVQKSMVKPFGDSCFFAPKNRVMIVETNYGIHVVQVTNKSSAQKKVQVALVEREVVPSKVTRSKLFAQMNDIAASAGSRQEFLDAAAAQNLVPRTASRITINDKDVHDMRNARELIRWAWKAEANDISSVLEISDKFVIATLLVHRKDGYAPVDAVSTEISTAVLQQKKSDIMLEEIRGLDVAAAAAKYNLTPQTAAGINFASFYITGIGVEPKLAGAVSGSQQGEIADAAGNAGVYAYKVTAVRQNTAPDDAAIAEERSRMQRMADQRAGYEVLNVLRSNAKIKDRRGETLY